MTKCLTCLMTQSDCEFPIEMNKVSIYLYLSKDRNIFQQYVRSCQTMTSCEPVSTGTGNCISIIKTEWIYNYVSPDININFKVATAKRMVNKNNIVKQILQTLVIFLPERVSTNSLSVWKTVPSPTDPWGIYTVHTQRNPIPFWKSHCVDGLKVF